MAKRETKADAAAPTSATVGYHVVLGLIFLKYISDAFEEQSK